LFTWHYTDETLKLDHTRLCRSGKNVYACLHYTHLKRFLNGIVSMSNWHYLLGTTGASSEPAVEVAAHESPFFIRTYLKSQFGIISRSKGLLLRKTERREGLIVRWLSLTGKKLLRCFLCQNYFFCDAMAIITPKCPPVSIQFCAGT
jgi:hypothetical protein